MIYFNCTHYFKVNKLKGVCLQFDWFCEKNVWGYKKILRAEVKNCVYVKIVCIKKMGVHIEIIDGNHAFGAKSRFHRNCVHNS